MTEFEQIDTEATEADQNTEATEADTEATEADNEATTEADQTDRHPNAEAAKYRRRLRETEAQRDALQAQVETLQRAEVERVASEVVRVPATLWTLGMDLSELRTEDGAIDADAVERAARQLAVLHGLDRGSDRSLAPSRGEGYTTRPRRARDDFTRSFGNL